MTIYIGIDDTDNATSRGTGRLARWIAAELSAEYSLLGVTRHQLLVDPRIPYTSHNSSAAILLDDGEDRELEALFGRLREMIESDFQPGSDPGLCVASAVPSQVVSFGRRAQREVVDQREARRLASEHGLLLEGLGGSQDGVIGALAAVGLASTGEDGRYLLYREIRELSGLQPVTTVVAAGVAAIQTLEGEPVEEGLLLSDRLRPSRRNGRPVQYVSWQEDHWEPLKVD
jgi:tRNA(Ile2) C34 agmatinyltransferase TiaS